jgi:hypothetical protein
MFSVNYNGSKSVDILTDIYLERSVFSGQFEEKIGLRSVMIFLLIDFDSITYHNHFTTINYHSDI